MSQGLTEFCAEARERIAGVQRILLASHIYPEADSVGSEAALARHLMRQGRHVSVCNPSPVPDSYRYLMELSGLPQSAWSHGETQIPQHDLLILLDVSDWDYMGALGERLRRSRAPKILFDHHQARSPGDVLALIDPDASATGEVLYRYFLATGAEVDARMASALYASILFDTGSFRLRNARDETLLIAAELIRRGASHTETVARLFENESFARIELLTAALNRVVSDADGRIAWTYVSTELFHWTRTSVVDADGVIDHLMAIRGVQLAILFRELPDGAVKVTFRSKGSHPVHLLAEELGGGGRPTAAGAKLKQSLKEAITAVIPRARALLLEPVLQGEERRNV
jgi:phosphoesterase RecJ-like protein